MYIKKTKQTKVYENRGKEIMENKKRFHSLNLYFKKKDKGQLSDWEDGSEY